MDMEDIPAFLRRKKERVTKKLAAVVAANTAPLAMPKEPVSIYAKNAKAAHEEIANQKERASANPDLVVYVPNPQQRLREKAADYLGDIEGMIDDGTVTMGWSLYEYFVQRSLGAPYARYFIDKFQPRVDELVEALAGNDEELRHAYRAYNDDELAELAALYLDMVQDAERILTNSLKQRKVHTRKAKPAAKVAKGVKFLDRAEKYKIVSIDPAKVVGCQELWTFNPTNKVLTVWRALDRGGLTWKGSAVKNFDEATSMAKTAGRHAADVIGIVLEGGKRELNKLMDAIPTEPRELRRQSRQTVLLRVL